MAQTVCGVVVHPPFSPSIMILLEKRSVFFDHWHFTAALYRWWNLFPERWDALGEITGMLLYEARRSYHSVFGKNFNTGIWLSYSLTPTAPIRPIPLE